MAKAIKKQVVRELTHKFQDTQFCLVLNYQGITSLEGMDFRTDLRLNKMRMNVVKNSLAGIALKGVGKGGVSELFKGPVALLQGDQVDPVAVAKKAVEWKAKLPKLAIRGAYLDGRVLSDKEVITLSRLPDRKALLGQVVGTLAAPMSGFATALNQIMAKFARVVAAVKDKKEKEGGAAPPASS